MKFKVLLLCIAGFAFSMFNPLCGAPVEVWTQDCLGACDLAQTKVHIFYMLPNENYYRTENYVTNDKGRLSNTLDFPVGTELNFIFEKKGYKATQSPMFIVPEGGYTGKYNEITFQGIDDWLYQLLRFFVTRFYIEDFKRDCFQLIVTICEKGGNMRYGPHGEKDATMTLTQMANPGKKNYERLYYFGVLFGKTAPSIKKKKTSADGGVVALNIKVKNTIDFNSGELYKVEAHKKGTEFSTAYFRLNPLWWKFLGITEQMLVNMCPPQGPVVLPRPIDKFKGYNI